jgi:cobalt-zinc-cadmium efflux system outer membrane protein
MSIAVISNFRLRKRSFAAGHKRHKHASSRLKMAAAGVVLGLLCLPLPVCAQGPVRITLDQAIQMGLEHNHSLQATRTLILQNQAQEVTANLRPNPVLSWDTQFIPVFNPNLFSHTTLDQLQQFDVGVGYLFERGKKRQHRLQAAHDATIGTKYQVTDAERALIFNVAQQYISALLAQSNLDLATQGLGSFQQTVDIGDAQYKAGQISEGDFLKIKLQLLQFQTDKSQAEVALVQARAGLRQLLGYEALSGDFELAGELAYQPVTLKLEDVQAKALALRPDLMAANQGVTAAQSQIALAKADGKVDLNAAMNYSHVSGNSSLSLFFNLPLPIFNRNQGEIARTRYVFTQAQQGAVAAQEQVMTDIRNAYETLTTSNHVVELYSGGYLKNSQDSRDISEYAYKRGAASLLDFLDAERSYRATQLAYRQALAADMIALEQLRQAVGTRNLP